MNSSVHVRPLQLLVATAAAAFIVASAGVVPAAASSSDLDGDGLSNTYERTYTLTNPLRRDSDGDGILDGNEDPDHDRLTNKQESLTGTHPRRADSNGDGIRDDHANPDGDALWNWSEFRAGTNPRRADTDRDGVPDGSEDPDRDGLTNREEQIYGTHPRKADTDADGYTDRAEIRARTNPLSASSHPQPAAPPTTVAGAFHVTTSGNDANNGSAGAPWRTLQKAANSLVAGQTVYIHPGTFDGFAMSRSGASGRPIRFAAYPGSARPTISGPRVDIIRLSALHDVSLEGLVVQGARGGAGSGAGIRIENGSSRVSVRNSLIRNNRSYGININNSSAVTVSGNEVTANEEGVYVSRSGEGVVIEGNRIHHQDKLVVNSLAPENDDHGAVGVVLDKTTGRILISANQLWANRAPSYDYGWDGGAFEIYGASNVTIAGNRTWDNENVLETGTDGSVCRNNVFRHNVSYGATSRGRSFGMFIRCGDNMLVANNVFHNLDQFVFSVGGSSRYNGSFEGLRIQNNIAVMASGKIIGIESALPASVVINNNLMANTSGGQIATVRGKGATTSLATFTAWTAYQRNGLAGDPRFVAAASHDYRLAAGSPAIDRGVVLFGTAIPYAGRAPDLGPYESGTP